MLNTLGIVELRPNAELPRPTACRRLAGKPLLEWVVRRMTESQRMDGVIVLAPRLTESADLADLVPRDVPLFTSESPDALSRYVDALGEFPAKHVVRVAAEHPFVDPVLIDRLVNTAANHPEADYVGFCSRNGQPLVQSPLGVFGEWIRATGFAHADRESTDACERENVTAYIYSRPERFQLRLLPIPQELDRDDLRLTIGGEEDWEHTQAIFEALGPENTDYQRIAHLLHHQPALRQRMAKLNRAVGIL